MDFSTRYDLLNSAQKEAVDSIEGPVMVIAGPGTGKTELLSMRAANILKRTDTLPESILCLTFTESGAAAMRERLAQIIGPDAYKIAVHTFHSFGAEIINQNSEFFYHGAEFRAADELSCYEILQSIFDSLEYNDPLASKQNGDYTYLRDSLTAISELKRSGLTSDELLRVLDANDACIETSEPLLAAVFKDRISKTALTQLQPLPEEIRRAEDGIDLPGITPLSQVLADSLETTLQDAMVSGSTKPITAWRNTWLQKSEKGEFILKARKRAEKLRALSYVYHQYLARMQEAKLYDFDDMILRVVHAMEVFVDLRLNLQEKFQYIMVDEFQDTNLAQMRILYNLTNNEVSSGRPNVLVVGDDDQAIYSFQGADIGNIHGFLDLFPATKRIVLTDNYRSSEKVLTHARNVITLGTSRLENVLSDLDKTLTPHFNPEKTAVELLEFLNPGAERIWCAETIKKLIEDGTPAESIAVFARRHHEIEALLPYFAKAGVMVNYERRDNVLELEPIQAIEHVAKLLVALHKGQHDIVDTLLPRILSHPAFAIEPVKLWQVSLRAFQTRQTWMEILPTDLALAPLHTWLLAQSGALSHTPLEYMLDEIIGTPSAKHPSETFVSPLYEYYFSQERLAEAPDQYLLYLEALRTIRRKLRDWRPNDTPTLQSFLEFIELHRRLDSPITSASPDGAPRQGAINLMTTHKSKGLEFDHVYVTGAVDNAWGERVRTRSRLISYPENLPLAPVGDTFDERLRLFFVAMTRARSHLTITYGTTDDSGKKTLPASFLVRGNWKPQQISTVITDPIQSAELAWYQPVVRPLSDNMRALLTPLLSTYKLSTTHLGSFLDVSRGGPQRFLLHNLLRFPQAPEPSAAYGSAIHAALQRAHTHLASTGEHRPIEDVLHDFEENLRGRRLSDKDLQTYLQKGSEVLTTYLEASYNNFKATQKAELSFANQNVTVGTARLTGTLDLVDIEDDSIVVTDYKTGKAAANWTGKTDYEKIKLHKYKQQLMFYNLLATHSRDYSKYTYIKGVLQFVEPTPAGEIIALEARFSRDDLEKFARLVQIVWQHIITLNLPDTSSYEPTYKGMLAFEQDLLEGDDHAS